MRVFARDSEECLEVSVESSQDQVVFKNKPSRHTIVRTLPLNLYSVVSDSSNQADRACRENGTIVEEASNNFEPWKNSMNYIKI